MLRQDLSQRAGELRAARVPFVHARVVLAERPTSAKPGDEAIVFGDGSIEGFVGGSCAEATVRDQSVALLGPGARLGSGEALMLRITPSAEADQPGKRVVHNPCLSGGTLEVFLEPALPPPLVVVVGDAPIARALESLGAALRYGVKRYHDALPPDAVPPDALPPDALPPDALPPDTVALVVASHGRGEEVALEAALRRGVPYVGLVASAKRGRAVLGTLAVSDELKSRVHTPAGLDLGAGTSEEVALAILAEIVASRPLVEPGPTVAGPVPPVAGRATDPVCGMAVWPDADGHGPHLDHDGQVIWFCGRGCLEAFAADPAAYGPDRLPA